MSDRSGNLGKFLHPKKHKASKPNLTPPKATLKPPHPTLKNPKPTK